jgi:hypothetical protein
MSNTHYDFNAFASPGSDLMSALRQLATAWDQFTRRHGILIQQKDNAASGNAVYAEIASAYGYSGALTADQQANAAASFAEMDSAFNIADAAITQMLDRHL